MGDRRRGKRRGKKGTLLGGWDMKWTGARGRGEHEERMCYENGPRREKGWAGKEVGEGRRSVDRNVCSGLGKEAFMQGACANITLPAGKLSVK